MCVYKILSLRSVSEKKVSYLVEGGEELDKTNKNFYLDIELLILP